MQVEHKFKMTAISPLRRWRVINARRLIGARLIDYVIINNLHNGRRIGVEFEQKIGHFVIGYCQFSRKVRVVES